MRPQRNHLRLVEPTTLPILTDAAARKRFNALAQALVDILIEMTDLMDGDPDLEATGEDFEDDDGF